MFKIKPGSLDYRILVAFMDIKTPVKPSELKDYLQIKHTTLNKALERLESDGIVKWHHYGNIELLKAGQQELKHIRNHQHLVSIFLKDSLGLNEESAEFESSKIARYFSCNLIEKLCLKYPNCEEHDDHQPYIHTSCEVNNNVEDC